MKAQEGYYDDFVNLVEEGYQETEVEEAESFQEVISSIRPAECRG